MPIVRPGVIRETIIVDGEIKDAQDAYDALSDEEKALIGARPVKYNLP